MRNSWWVQWFGGPGPGPGDAEALQGLLTRIYRHYRQYLHHRSLDGQGGVIGAGELSSERATIIGIWRETMEAADAGAAPPL